MSKPKFFLNDPAPGKPFSMKGLAEGLRNLAYAVQNISMHGGHINWGPDGAPKIIYDKGETPPGEDAENYPFKGIISAGGVTVSAGTWTRNGIEISGGGVEVAAGEGDYVWLELLSTGDVRDPALVPDDLGIRFGASRPDDLAPGNIYRVLGQVVSGLWVPAWTGGSIDDIAIVADGSQNVSATGARSTLEFNIADAGSPDPFLHQKELQLFGVDECVASTLSVPAFLADSTGGGGALQWHPFDSQYATLLQRSVTGYTSGVTPSKIVQLWQFDNALDQHALICDLVQDDLNPTRQLRYVYPALYEGGPLLTGAGTGPTVDSTSFSIMDGAAFTGSLNDTTYVLSLSGYFRPYYLADGRTNLGAQEAMLTTIDLSPLRDGFALTGHQHDIADITGGWGEIEKVDRPAWFAHSELRDMPSSGNADHDLRYLRIGVGTAGEFRVTNPTTGAEVTLTFADGLLIGVA